MQIRFFPGFEDLPRNVVAEEARRVFRDRDQPIQIDAGGNAARLRHVRQNGPIMSCAGVRFFRRVRHRVRRSMNEASNWVKRYSASLPSHFAMAGLEPRVQGDFLRWSTRTFAATERAS